MLVKAILGCLFRRWTVFCGGHAGISTHVMKALDLSRCGVVV